jgi:hypothetical protein
MEPGRISLDERYKKSTSIVSRIIAGEAVLVPIHQKVGDMDCIYSLNETAASAWDLLDGVRTLAMVRDQIVTEFEVQADEATQDLLGLISGLVEIGAVTKV